MTLKTNGPAVATAGPPIPTQHHATTPSHATAPRFDADEVRARLTIGAVLQAEGIKAVESGGEVRFRTCPCCGNHAAPDVSADIDSGRWYCFSCAQSGDLFDFVAHSRRLDIRAEFPDVLAVAASMAGVGPSTAPQVSQQARQVRRAQERADAKIREAREREAKLTQSRQIAASCWNDLSTSSTAGEAYIASRGLAALIGHPRIRYSRVGWPSVPLFYWDGSQINDATRRFDDASPIAFGDLPDVRWPHIMREGDPKSRGLKGCTTAGTLLGRLCDIAPYQSAVIAEGVFDSLTALLCWPAALVLGAHNAGTYATVARMAAPVVKAAQGRLLLVCDNDAAGQAARDGALSAATAAGLVVGESVRVVDIGPHKDLNAAYQAGWRP